jgi:hypothetical protein
MSFRLHSVTSSDTVMMESTPPKTVVAARILSRAADKSLPLKSVGLAHSIRGRKEREKKREERREEREERGMTRERGNEGEREKRGRREKIWRREEREERSRERHGEERRG